MIGELLKVIFEHPLLTTVFIVDIFLIALIIGFVFLRLFGKTRPDRRLLFFLQKFRIQFKEKELKTIEDIYELAMSMFAKKGLISYEDNTGFLAREKVLKNSKDQENEIAEQIFRYYEQKKYGGSLENEHQVVNYLAHRIRNL